MGSQSHAESLFCPGLVTRPEAGSAAAQQEAGGWQAETPMGGKIRDFRDLQGVLRYQCGSPTPILVPLGHGSKDIGLPAGE